MSGIDFPVAERHERWMGSFAAEERSVLLTRDVLEAVARSVQDRADSSVDPPAAPQNPLNRVLLMDMQGYLENDILVKLDRASMMASLEGRVPLLNNDFVAYATRLPLELKRSGAVLLVLVRLRWMPASKSARSE